MAVCGGEKRKKNTLIILLSFSVLLNINLSLNERLCFQEKRCTTTQTSTSAEKYTLFVQNVHWKKVSWFEFSYQQVILQSRPISPVLSASVIILYRWLNEVLKTRQTDGAYVRCYVVNLVVFFVKSDSCCIRDILQGLPMQPVSSDCFLLLRWITEKLRVRTE